MKGEAFLEAIAARFAEAAATGNLRLAEDWAEAAFRRTEERVRVPDEGSEEPASDA